MIFTCFESGSIAPTGQALAQTLHPGGQPGSLTSGKRASGRSAVVTTPPSINLEP